MAVSGGSGRLELDVTPANRGQSRQLDYELFLDCVHCGLCTASCPTYLETGQEADSPRGRIYLMRAVTDGRLHPDQSVRRHLDLCLDCRACESACPSGVQYGQLIESFRINLARTPTEAQGPGLLKRLILFHITPSAKRTRLALLPARFLQWTRLDKLLARLGFPELLPSGLKQLYEMVPCLQSSPGPLPEVLLPEGQRRARVALFTGCAADAFFPNTNWAAARVLQRNGCEVHIPRRQVCCGALHYHAARLDRAKAYAQRNCEVLEADFAAAARSLDAIVVTAAGCGAMLKDYDRLLSDTCSPTLAKSFAGKVKDISEFLMELGPVRPAGVLPIRAVYHDACHLCHAQQIREPPRQLLELIPGMVLVPLAETEICCGAAGSYNLTEPEMSERLGRRKIANILNTKVEAAFASNVGCLLQLGRYLQQSNARLRLGHPIDALWASYSGETQGFLQQE